MNPVIPVFISSPGDVQKERQLTEDAVHELAPRLARLFGVTVVPLLWEQFAPISSFDATHPQTGLGGIRGLGTWGVGHLVDHESAPLVAMAKASMKGRSNDDVQLLLEVTYENFRITEVRDVSDEDRAFFEKRDTDEHIEKRLEDRRDWLPGSEPNRAGAKRRGKRTKLSARPNEKTRGDDEETE